MTTISTIPILNSLIAGNLIGFGITKLHPRGIFQSISDYFARKSGNERISFLVATDQNIYHFHTRGNEILESIIIPQNQITEIKSWNKSNHDPKQLDVQITTQQAGKKAGDFITKTFDFEIFPAFLGQNSSKIEKLSEILENKNQFDHLISYFESFKKS